MDNNDKIAMYKIVEKAICYFSKILYFKSFCLQI